MISWITNLSAATSSSSCDLAAKEIGKSANETCYNNTDWKDADTHDKQKSSKAKNGKKSAFYLQGIHPMLLLFLVMASGFFLYYSISSKPRFRTDSPHFQLAQSSVFQKLVQCNDVSDGVECFKKYRSDLQADSRIGLNPISQVQLESCLDVVSKNANDLALLLNVQTCYHQADILDRSVEFNQAGSGTSWFVITGVLISIFIQLFISFHSFITFVFRDKTDRVLHGSIKSLQESFNLLHDKCLEQADLLSSAIVTENSNYKNVQGRLNRNGDIRREIDTLVVKVNDLIDETNMTKQYVYASASQGGFGHFDATSSASTVAILPPSPAIPTSGIRQGPGNEHPRSRVRVARSGALKSSNIHAYDANLAASSVSPKTSQQYYPKTSSTDVSNSIDESAKHKHHNNGPNDGAKSLDCTTSAHIEVNAFNPKQGSTNGKQNSNGYDSSQRKKAVSFEYGYNKNSATEKGSPSSAVSPALKQNSGASFDISTAEGRKQLKIHLQNTMSESKKQPSTSEPVTESSPKPEETHAVLPKQEESTTPAAFKPRANTTHAALPKHITNGQWSNQTNMSEAQIQDAGPGYEVVKGKSETENENENANTNSSTKERTKEKDCENENSEDMKVQIAASNALLAKKQPLRYCDIQKYGDVKKYRRVHVPVRGWVSIRKFEEEEQMYGRDSLIRLN